MAARKFSRAVTRTIRNSKHKPKTEDGKVLIPIMDSRFILARLRQAHSLVTTAVGALINQNADHDADIASVLRHSLGALLIAEISRFETLLGEADRDA